MNTLIRLNNRLDPSAAIFSHHLDDLLSGFIKPLPGETRSGVAPIKIEVTEDASAYRVSAVLPGVKKEDIHIEVDQKEVSILAEIKRETVAPAEPGKAIERVLHSERFYGNTALTRYADGSSVTSILIGATPLRVSPGRGLRKPDNKSSR